jgi:phosphate transport system substrate-binding protein
MALYVDEVSATSLDFRSVDLAFRIGNEVGSYFAAPVGYEQIVVIVNADNPLSRLSIDQLQVLFTGQLTQWDVLGGSQQMAQVWSYPEGDDVRQVFDDAILGGQRLTTFAQLAPDPQAMLEAVSDDPAAIGYLPERWLKDGLNPNVRVLPLAQTLADSLRQPILALAVTEPEGITRTLLLCLQGAAELK